MAVWAQLVVGLTILPLVYAQTGEITGRIRVTSKLTRKRLSIPQIYDRTSALAGESPAAAPDIEVEAELRRVVVYLDSAGLPARPARAVMDQRQRRFEPDVIAVPVGSTVVFPNSDPIFHNVFSLSKAKQFDLGNYKKGESRNVTFHEPGVVQLNCHLHPNMSAAIMVTPNNWIAQPSAASGEFSLAGVPPGRYTLVAWHKSAGFFRRKIEVRPDHPVTVDFEIPLATMARR